MKSVVAFDFDGTLLDSRNRHIIVMRDVLNLFNIDLDVDDLVEFKRNGKNNLDYMMAKGIDENVAKTVQKQWVRDIELSKYLENDVLYSDAIELLDKYSKNNDLILVTARANVDGLNAQIDKFDLRKYFSGIFVVQPGKTAAVAKAEILNAQNAILMVGDTNSDASAAKIAGAEFLFRENGFHNKNIIKD